MEKNRKVEDNIYILLEYLLVFFIIGVLEYMKTLRKVKVYYNEMLSLLSYKEMQ
jgi:hypothetical protein